MLKELWFQGLGFQIGGFCLNLGVPGRSSYESNSGPGFWTGLGAGGLLGYLAGNRR